MGRSKTLDETIAELEALRKIHGGKIEVACSAGPVSFKSVQVDDDTFIVLTVYGGITV